MRKETLFTWMTCLLLGAVSGCNNKPPAPPYTKSSQAPNGGQVTPGGGHGSTRLAKADKGTLELPSSNKIAPHSNNSVFADENGTLTFETNPSRNSTIEVDFSQNGAPSNLCQGTGSKVSGQSSATCHILPGTAGDYNVIVTETSTAAVHHGKKSQTYKGITAYIRPCNNCQLE